MKNIPPRPQRKDVQLEAIRSFLDENDADYDWDAETIAERSTYDGFDLMLSLSRSECWDFDREDLDLLDDLVGFIDDALHDAELSWADDNDVISKALPIGTMIKQGCITGICDHRPASYLVQEPNSESGRRLIIKFENAILES